mmetsp:Transcript_15346/g.32294  ORF Transcript_15346/g.32294 Transcript_15346/m.32294 type:complete len:83 (-) Transcript_15346:3240-3488(-)
MNGKKIVDRLHNNQHLTIQSINNSNHQNHRQNTPLSPKDLFTDYFCTSSPELKVILYCCIATQPLLVLLPDCIYMKIRWNRK